MGVVVHQAKNTIKRWASEDKNGVHRATRICVLGGLWTLFNVIAIIIVVIILYPLLHLIVS